MTVGWDWMGWGGWDRCEENGGCRLGLDVLWREGWV